jgi:hypothetical protein
MPKYAKSAMALAAATTAGIATMLTFNVFASPVISFAAPVTSYIVGKVTYRNMTKEKDEPLFPNVFSIDYKLIRPEEHHPFFHSLVHCISSISVNDKFINLGIHLSVSERPLLVNQNRERAIVLYKPVQFPN